MSKKLFIFSNQITANSDGSYLISNFVVNNVNRFQVPWIQLPPSFNTISAARGNNTFKILSTVITITDGTYDIANLCSFLDTQAKLIDATFTVTYSGITQRVTIARTGNFTIDLSLSTAAKLLGFATSGTLTGAATYTGTSAYNPMDLGVINLHIDNLKYFVESETIATFPDYILSIPLTKSLDSYITYKPENPEDFTFKNGNVVLSNSRIYFTYPEGNKIINFNGVPWYLRIDFFRTDPQKIMGMEYSTVIA